LQYRSARWRSTERITLAREAQSRSLVTGFWI